MDAANNLGSAVKREDVYKMAESTKAFAHIIAMFNELEYA